MVNQFLKKKSKRVSAKKRYKIEKKVKEHKKKEKRLAKKNPNSRKRKDPGIPNTLPFKESILREAEERKRRAEEKQTLLREKRKKERLKILAKKRNLEGLVKDAQKRSAEFDKKLLAHPETHVKQLGNKPVETSLKTYYKEFKKVVDAADVVLEVLDARDPLGSRCSEMEEAILSSGTNKRLVLLLNKIDLVPRENVEAWLKYLRNEFPAVAFKASTQTQSENLSQSKVPLSKVSDDLLKSSHCIGADLLMTLLGNYCRNKDIKTSIRVGVVGFPNTGKSSVINSLKRSKACTVGSVPGVTKTMQEVHLDKHIKLLDSPGIVMANNRSDSFTVLRNCVRLENLDDLVEPVEAILRRCPKQQLMLHYVIPDFKDANEFLSLMAKRMGRLKKGGVPDINRAAKLVLQDWLSGKITYYTHPPEQQSLPTHISATFVKEMGKEFNIDDIVQKEQATIEGLESRSNKHILVESLGPAAAVMDESQLASLTESQSDEEMSDEDEDWNEEDFENEPMERDSEDELRDVTVSVTSSKGKRSKLKSKAEQVEQLKLKSAEKKKTHIMQLNKARKRDFKRMKKQRKRSDKVATALSDAMDGAFNF